MFRFLLDATANGADGSSMLIMVAVFAVFFILWYVIALRPQRKKEKELQEKISKMRVGDQVVTIGGLVGKVANIRDDEVTIMTSAANTLVTFKKSAVSTIISRDAKPEDTASKEEKKDKLVLKKKEKASSEEIETEEKTEKEATDLGNIKE
ncbi:MAG: preprotein translocase subunit YajC [Clostridiales bacterium]|nr:preprotein translocase subunit YajC [Clostridiales bacterium]